MAGTEVLPLIMLHPQPARRWKNNKQTKMDNPPALTFVSIFKPGNELRFFESFTFIYFLVDTI